MEGTEEVKDNQGRMTRERKENESKSKELKEMQTSTYGPVFKVVTVLAFLIMVTINAVGNILLLNGMSTGMVADAYPNLFAPAGLTFSIWGIIYLLLACYTLYQLGLFQKKSEASDPKLMKTISIYFIISSLANAGWIFAWHYQRIAISMLLMVVILICLILVNKQIQKSQLFKREEFFLKLPFSIYFGWITVATIANATVLLVSIGWDGFGISAAVWASIIITMGMLIGGARLLKDKDIAYGIVLIWADLGILIKHVGESGFDGRYPSVIAVVIACIVLFIAAEVYILVSRQKGLA